jgi:hypothetical protein
MLLDVVTTSKMFAKKVRQPQYKCHTILTKNMVLVERCRAKLVLDRPLFIAAAVLDIAKACMYKYHYITMDKMFPKISYKLIYTDTDSLIYVINDTYENVYSAFLQFFKHHDFSNFPDNTIYTNETTNPRIYKNQSKINKMKFETGSFRIAEIVCLRPKCYSIKLLDKPIKMLNKYPYGEIRKAKVIIYYSFLTYHKFYWLQVAELLICIK